MLKYFEPNLLKNLLVSDLINAFSAIFPIILIKPLIQPRLRLFSDILIISAFESPVTTSSLSIYKTGLII